MEIEKSKFLIQFVLIFRRSGDVLFFVYARRLRGYTAKSSFLQECILDKEILLEFLPTVRTPADI